jgi:disulfide bond formation protein DsbB
MNEFINSSLIYSTLVLHALIVFVFVAFFFRASWGRSTVNWVGEYAPWLGFLLGLATVMASFAYSLVLGYEPCELCWWQRVFLFPMLPIYAVGLYKRDRGAYAYTLPLATVAGLIALYHTYIQLGGTSSILPCTAVGGACTKVYVLAFGYITIPTMSFTAAAGFLLLALIQKYYDKNQNSNA